MDATRPFTYRRRRTWTVDVGGVAMGSDHPIRLQSMTSTSTLDTPGSVAQAERIIDAGGEYVRLTAQGVREAENLAAIRAALRADGYATPLVADIHFNPKAALAAARNVEKVRINPGNFIDPARTFKSLQYTDEEYAEELRRLDDALDPLVSVCRENGTALRIGVNHGSLSDRIMSRYGDTPAGMTESAMEFLRSLHRKGFDRVCISIKASNTVVMVETVRRLVAAMDAEDLHYPLHLGVTEAGNGEDGRVKSAVGIGALLLDGIGDTIRVSLSEDPECEIPVAAMLAAHAGRLAQAPEVAGEWCPGYDPIAPSRRLSRRIGGAGGGGVTLVIGHDDIAPDLIADIDADLPAAQLVDQARKAGDKILRLSTRHPNAAGALRAAMHALQAAGVDNPFAAVLDYGDMPEEEVTVAASADFGALLLAGWCDAIEIRSRVLSAERRASLALAILQAARRRFTHTEYISCPGCGRTLFDLQSTVNEIKAATSHLPHLKIGVMGCIVNGPGEMADADYGYVGAAAGRVSLYKGKECIEKNIPSEQALGRLIELLKSEGKWQEPE